MELLLHGFQSIFTLATLPMIFIGVTFGMIMGALPGLSTTMAIALALPLTFGMEPIPAMGLLMGIFAGGVAGGLISAILVNIPGTPAAVATTFDGYAMCKKGQAGRALGIALLSKYFGEIISITALVCIAPPLARFALKFGPYELFGLGLCSLTMIATLSDKSVLKGLLSGLFGLAATLVGSAPIDGYPRYTFGLVQLQAGFDILPFLIGLFGFS